MGTLGNTIENETAKELNSILKEESARICVTMQESTNATAENLARLRGSIIESSKSSEKLATRAHQLTLALVVIGLLGVIVAALHVWISYLSLI